MSRGRLVEGIVLVALGLVLLGNTLGYFSWSVWLDASRFWPVILVLIGVLVLLRRRVPGILILVMVVLIGLNAARIPLDFVGPGFWNRHWGPRVDERGGLESGTSHVETPLEQGVSSADVSVDLSAGNIEIKGGAAHLIDGDLDYIGSEPQVSYRREGPRAVVNLKGGLAGRRSGGPAPKWLMRLTNAVPVSLTIDAGAGRADMDFSDVRLSALRVDTGAGQFRAVFGDHGLQTDVSMSTGAADITLVVPAAVGLRIKVSSAATGGNLSDSGLKKSGDFWVSDNFASARSTVDVKVSSAVSRVHVERP